MAEKSRQGHGDFPLVLHNEEIHKLWCLYLHKVVSFVNHEVLMRFLSNRCLSFTIIITDEAKAFTPGK